MHKITPSRMDFEKTYQKAEDPWNVGDASGNDYDQCINWVQPLAPKSIVDLGCGKGALTRRLRTLCDNVLGIDVSPTAISKAQFQSTDIKYRVVDLRYIQDLEPCDVFVCKDVIYYLSNDERLYLLQEIQKKMNVAAYFSIPVNFLHPMDMHGVELFNMLDKYFWVYNYINNGCHAFYLCKHKEKE